MMDDQVKVMGLSKLLLTVAERLENGIDGLLNKELLISSAAKIDALEAVASIASSMIASVPRKAKGKTLKRSLVHRDEVIALSTALREAGYPTKNYV